jgi:regulatory protein
VRVKSLSRNNQNYQVTLIHENGSESVFSLSEDLVVEYRLVPGKGLDHEVYSAFLRSADLDGIYQKTLIYALRYPQTEAGIRTYLSDRSVRPEIQEVIVGKLVRLGVLDDGIYARQYVEDHGKNRREGPVKIAYDLQRRGISREILTRALEGLSPETETANLNALFDQKIPALQGYPQQKAMMMMSRYLISKGYDSDRVQAFVSARSGIFATRHPDDELIRADYREVLRLADRAGWKGPERRTKIIHRLMQKGYRYPSIQKEMGKGEDSDE